MSKEQVDETSPIDIIDDLVEELEYDVLLFEGFQQAIIGVSRHRMDEPLRVVYDCDKMIQILMTREEMSQEEAEKFVDRSAMSSWIGKATPIIMTPLSAIEGY